MSLIGDVIIGARELIPDMPQVIPALVTPTASVIAAGGSTLPVGTYALVITFITPWGETIASTEVTGLVVGANQGIQISAPSLPPSATGMNAYLTLAGGAAGSEQLLYQSSVIPFTISTVAPAAATPPTRNTAWLPDTNGKFISAGTVYRWLNEGLRRLSLKVGGLQDYTAVGSTSGQSLYPLTGQWRKLQSVWYDGFPLGFGNQRGFFRRNQIQSSVLASAAISINTNVAVLEVFYQPIRTAGQSTLTGAISPTSTTAALAALTNFQPFGPPMFALIGNEIVAYAAQSGLNLTGLIRGIGGTTPQSWPIGTLVRELNIPVLGKRLHTIQYVPGNALNTLPLPVGWESILPTYILSRSRDAEQDTQSATKYLKDFDDAALELLRANRQIAGPVQVGDGMYGAEVVPGLGTSLGGVVLP